MSRTIKEIPEQRYQEILEEAKKRALADWLERTGGRGYAEEFAEGFEIGFAKGFAGETGERKFQLETARRMLADGKYSLEEIVNLLELSYDEVAQLKAEQKA